MMHTVTNIINMSNHREMVVKRTKLMGDTCINNRLALAVNLNLNLNNQD